MNFVKTPQFVFVIFAFIFGLIMLFVTPQFKVPDEQAHFMRAKEVSAGVLYNNPKKADSTELHGASGYSPVMFTASALGYRIGSLHSENTGFYSGRFCNLLLWIALIVLAITITPVFKWQFMFCALLPMSLFEAMSYSADSFNTAFVFLFFAYIFKLIYSEKALNKLNIGILSVMSIISAFVKGAVYPIFLFVFLPFKKHKYLFSILCLVVSSALMIYWASINYTYVNPLADAEYHRNLLIHNPFDFLVMYFKTLFYNLTFYIRSCIGYLGLLDVKFNSLVYVVYFILFVSMFFVLPEKKITRGQKWVSILAVVIFTTFLHLMYYINWTSPMDAKITGIQGRYFIPILPFLFIIFTQKSEYFSEKFRINYKVFLSAAVFFLLIYVSVVLKIYYNL